MIVTCQVSHLFSQRQRNGAAGGVRGFRTGTRTCSDFLHYFQHIIHWGKLWGKGKSAEKEKHLRVLREIMTKTAVDVGENPGWASQAGGVPPRPIRWGVKYGLCSQHLPLLWSPAGKIHLLIKQVINIFYRFIRPLLFSAPPCQPQREAAVRHHVGTGKWKQSTKVPQSQPTGEGSASLGEGPRLGA